MNIPTPAVQANRVTQLEKTAEDREAELSSLLSATSEKLTMPADVAKICDLLSGQTFKLGKKELASIPPTKAWGMYESKKGKLEGEVIYTCLGRYSPIAFGNVGNRHISISIQVSILPIKLQQ